MRFRLVRRHLAKFHMQFFASFAHWRETFRKGASKNGSIHRRNGLLPNVRSIA